MELGHLYIDSRRRRGWGQMFLAHRSQARTVIGCSRLLLLGERGSGGLLEDLNTGSPGSWGQGPLSGPNSGGQPQHSHSETGRFRGCANAYRRLSDFYQAVQWGRGHDNAVLMAFHAGLTVFPDDTLLCALVDSSVIFAAFFLCP